jgi:predicted RNA-binding Zn ribbon-like protein
MSDPEFILLGDAVWIDFINTARGRQPDSPDGLADAAAYHRWSKAEKLASDATEVPWPEVLDFRARLLSVATALADDHQPPSSAIHEINRLLMRAEGHHQLTRVGGAWQLAFTSHRTPSALEAIAQSAALTLADAEARVHQCRAAPCTLFFVDRSPGHTRTWCSAEAAAHPTTQIERRRVAR